MYSLHRQPKLLLSSQRVSQGRLGTKAYFLLTLRLAYVICRILLLIVMKIGLHAGWCRSSDFAGMGNNHNGPNGAHG